MRTYLLAAIALSVITFTQFLPAHADYEVGMNSFKGNNGPSEEAVYVAKTQQEWDQLWTLVGEQPSGTFKEGKTIAVAVFLGERPSGDRLRARKAQMDDDRLELKVTWTRAAANSSGETIKPWLIALVHEYSDRAVADLRVKAQPLP